MISTKYYDTLVSTLLISFLVFNFIDRSLANLSLILLLLISIVFIFSDRNCFIKEKIRDFFIPFIQLFAIITIAHLYHSAEIKELDNYSRLILLLPIYLLLCTVEFNKNTFIKIIIILSIISLVSSGIYYLMEEKILFSERIHINEDSPNRINPVSSTAITYGNLCMTLFLLNFCALLSKNKVQKKYIYLGIVMSLLSWSFSMTIGSLVGLIFFILFLFFKSFMKISIKNITGLAGLLIIIALTPLSNKFQLYVVDIKNLIQGDSVYTSNIDNSIKERVFYIDSAFDIIKENKFIGIGFNKFEEEVKNRSMVREIKIEARDHPHNDFLDIGIKAGFLGIVSLIIFYLLLYRFFNRYLYDNSSYFCISGLSVLLSQLGYMMTQTQFSHHQAIVFFLILLFFFASQIKKYERSDI